MGESTARLPFEQPLIDAYGDMGFRIRGVRHEGSLLLLPDALAAWPPLGAEAVSLEDFMPVLARKGPIEILLFGTGIRFIRPAPALHQAFVQAGIGLEPMDTGAACRTYNVLLSERRRVAAALIAIA